MDIPVPKTAPPASPPAPERNNVLTRVIGIIIIIAACALGAWLISTYDWTLQTSNTSSIDPYNYDEVIARANAQLERNPNNVSALVSKAFALGQKGASSFNAAEYGAQAAAAAELAIKANPNNGDSYRALGYALELQEKFPEAHAAYQASLEFDPKTALVSDAHVYELEGNWNKAMSGYEAALVANPSAYSARLGLGRVEAALGNLEGSRNEFQTVYNETRDLSQRARAAYSIAMILIGDGEYDQARGYLTYANAFDPDYASGWFGMGSVLYAQSMTSDLGTDIKEKLLSASAEAMKQAVAFTPITRGGFVKGEFISDLYVVGDATLFLEALQVAKDKIPNDPTLQGDGKTALLSGFEVIMNTVKAGPPFVNND